MFISDCPVPYILILGGTDVNEYNQDPEMLQRMWQALHKARHLTYYLSCLYDVYYHNKYTGSHILPLTHSALGK